MYICICRGITEEKVKKAMKGAASSHDVLKKLGVGDDCGVCLVNAIERIQTAAKSQKK